ncbi:hypothetical protein HCH29_03635 [Enterococcus gilvus]|nr:hypothetical protein [Enterococcus gilvus]
MKSRTRKNKPGTDQMSLIVPDSKKYNRTDQPFWETKFPTVLLTGG